MPDKIEHAGTGALLADFMNFIGAASDAERDQATEMLNTIDDLSSHESSPTKDMDEAEETRSTRMRTGRTAMISLQGAMAMQLQGCVATTSFSSSSTDGSWFSFAFLMTWTLLLAGYSWYMLPNTNKFSNVQLPLFADTLSVAPEPQVTHESTSIEGLVTWTFVRIRGKLRRATTAGNIGASMRYQEIQRWLETCLCHLPTASSFDRRKVLESIGDEHERELTNL